MKTLIALSALLTVLMGLSTALALPDIKVNSSVSDVAGGGAVTIPIDVKNIGDETAENVVLAIKDDYAGKTAEKTYALSSLTTGQTVSVNYEVVGNGEHIVFMSVNTTSNELNLFNNWHQAKATITIAGKDVKADMWKPGGEMYMAGKSSSVFVSVSNFGTETVSNITLKIVSVKNGAETEVWNKTIETLNASGSRASTYTEIVSWMPAGGENVLKLTATVEGDVNPADNIATMDVSAVGLVRVNFSMKDGAGNYAPHTVEFGNEYRVVAGARREFSIPNTAQTIIVAKTVSEATRRGYETVKFLNSVPKQDMGLVFEDLWNRQQDGRYFHHIYAFKPDWTYNGIEVEFESYPDVEGLTVYGCSSWNWVAKMCNTEWMQIGMRSGSIIGDASGGSLEAAGIGSPTGIAALPSGITTPSGVGGVPTWGSGASLTQMVKEAVKNVSTPVSRKNETLTECADEGGRKCVDGNLHVCADRKTTMYECFYGCDEAEKKCIEVQPPARFYSENPAMDAEIIIFITVTGILAAGAVLMFLQWESLRKNAKRIRKKK